MTRFAYLLVPILACPTQTITSISADDKRATMYGRFDLTWQNKASRYNWIGNWLIVARKEDGRWLVTHMMVSDADAKVEKIAAE